MVPGELSGNMAVSLLRRAGINSYRLFLSRKLRSSFHPAITRQALRKITAKKLTPFLVYYFICHTNVYTESLPMLARTFHLHYGPDFVQVFSPLPH